jgi:hypothetical protein
LGIIFPVLVFWTKKNLATLRGSRFKRRIWLSILPKRRRLRLPRSLRIGGRVARWFILKPKIPILEGLRLEKMGIVYGPLKYFTDIWDIL